APVSEASVPPAGSGVVWTDQLFLSQLAGQCTQVSERAHRRVLDIASEIAKHIELRDIARAARLEPARDGLQRPFRVRRIVQNVEQGDQVEGRRHTLDDITQFEANMTVEP